jgi:light-regulated signal transduction histidine kinase (bacteriophytochrome)
MSCEDALDQALKNLQHSIESSGAIVTREPLPRIHGNATQITLVFQNLIANSLKFHSQRVPAVHVRAERIGSDWRFSIEDNGIGMEPRHLERIFIMFQRLNSRKKYAGTGVGLAICRRVVELHGGRIWAESGLGKGTTFYFVIPAGARAAEPGPEAKPAPDRALIRSGPAAG